MNIDDFLKQQAYQEGLREKMLKQIAVPDTVQYAMPAPTTVNAPTNTGNEEQAAQSLANVRSHLAQMPVYSQHGAPAPAMSIGEAQAASIHGLPDANAAYNNMANATNAAAGARPDSILVGILKQMIGGAIKNKVTANDKQATQEEYAAKIDALQKMRKDLTPDQFAFEMMKLGDDVGQAGQQDFIARQKPKGGVRPFVGGVEGQPLQRQQYVLDENGQPHKLDIPPYAAFQAPEQWQPPQPTGIPGVTTQESTRGKVTQMQRPDQYDVTQDPDTGAIVSRNLTTGEIKVTSPTEAQGKAAAQSGKATVIDTQLNRLFSSGFDPTKTDDRSATNRILQSFVDSDIPIVAAIGSAAMNTEERRYKQIRDGWNELYLRDESGAAIAKHEWNTKERVYWPGPGDSPQDVEDKAQLRKAAEQGLYGKKLVDIKKNLDIKSENTSSLDNALSMEGIASNDPIASIAHSIYQQETSSGKNTRTSNRGSVGPMQVMPGTFAKNADKGWDINNPTHNLRAAVREIKLLSDANKGDPTLIAAGYYGGQGGANKATNNQAVSDPKNPNAPNTLQYANQVVTRMLKPQQPLNQAIPYDPLSEELRRRGLR
jgi:hypothetical protein